MTKKELLENIKNLKQEIIQLKKGIKGDNGIELKDNKYLKDALIHRTHALKENKKELAKLEQIEGLKGY